MNTLELHLRKMSISELSFGCEALGGVDWGKVDITEVRYAIDLAWERGVRIFDTADVYGLGNSEVELARALGSRRHDALIISKFGCRWDRNRTFGERSVITKDCSPQYMEHAIVATLRRLKLDCLPIYFAHWPDDNTPLEDTLGALGSLKDRGLINHFGLSNHSCAAYTGVTGAQDISAIQGPLSLIETSGLNTEYDHAKKQQIVAFVYGPLGQGILTGKYNKTSRFAGNDRRHRLGHFSDCAWANIEPLLNVLQNIALEYDKTMTQVALRWILEQKLITSVIVGVKTRKQALENFDVLSWHLDPDSVRSLNEASVKFRALT